MDAGRSWNVPAENQPTVGLMGADGDDVAAAEKTEPDWQELIGPLIHGGAMRYEEVLRHGMAFCYAMRDMLFRQRCLDRGIDPDAEPEEENTVSREEYLRSVNRV